MSASDELALLKSIQVTLVHASVLSTDENIKSAIASVQRGVITLMSAAMDRDTSTPKMAPRVLSQSEEREGLAAVRVAMKGVGP